MVKAETLEYLALAQCLFLTPAYLAFAYCYLIAIFIRLPYVILFMKCNKNIFIMSRVRDFPSAIKAGVPCHIPPSPS